MKRSPQCRSAPWPRGHGARAIALAALAAVSAHSCGLPGKGSGAGGKFRRCADAPGDGKGSVEAGKIVCSWDGREGSCSGGDPSSLDLCVLAGAAASGETSSNVRQFVSACSEGGPDAVVVLGDAGETAGQIEATIGMAAKGGVPVLAIPGGSEPYGEYLEAIDSARERGLAVVDLSRVRTIRWGERAIVSLPGIRNPWYLRHEGQGCGWDEDDLDDLSDLLEGAAGQGGATKVILLGGWPPGGRGQWGVDIARDGSHVGDEALGRLLEKAGVTFGVFGSVYESGGTGVDPESGKRLAQGAWLSSMFVNPGSIEAVPWEGEGGGGFSVGQAAVVQVGPKGGRYFVWRVR